MATKIDVLNRALIKLGSEPLMSESDNNVASRAIEVVYDGLLERLLRSYRWAFAIRRQELPALVDGPVFGYQYAYQLPADCLRIDAITSRGMPAEWHDRISDAFTRPAWQQEGRTIVTDIEAPLLIRYGADITEPGQWDATFVNAFACLLADELCEKITQSSTKRQAAQQELAQAISDARAASAIERPSIQQRDTSWYTARL